MTDIKINDNRNKPLSFDQAVNKMTEMKSKDMKAEAKKAVADFKITDASAPERMKFLSHAIKHYPIRGDDDRAMKQLLWYRMQGVGYEELARIFHTKPGLVKNLEKVAVETLKEAIDRVQKTQVPIIGSPN